MNLKDIGRMGEDNAVKYLENLNYEILERNFRGKYGEIDIIARDGKYISFVEVKTRNINTKYPAYLAVNKFKKNKIIFTADEYFIKNKCKLYPRFDIIEIYFNSNYDLKINHIKNAFSIENYNGIF